MRSLLALVAAVALAAGALSGCAQGSGTTSSAAPTASVPATATAAPVTHSREPKRKPAHRPARHPAKPRRHKTQPVHAGALAVSSASGSVVQPQPALGSCHAKGSGLYSEPDQACTPGAINPAVTQATIDQTICVSGWTATVRPSESITEPEKQASMAAYGDGGSMHDYEYDHLVSLELGGAVNDARNLWPEPGGSPNPKDRVENALHRMVCDGQIQLAQAQRIIATDWVAWANAHGYGTGSASSQTSATPVPAPPHTTTAPPSTASNGPNKPVADVNCSDFPTHAAAQQWFERHGGSPSNDVAGLDRDHDGLACESLP